MILISNKVPGDVLHVDYFLDDLVAALLLGLLQSHLAAVLKPYFCFAIPRRVAELGMLLTMLQIFILYQVELYMNMNAKCNRVGVEIRGQPPMSVKRNRRKVCY